MMMSKSGIIYKSLNCWGKHGIIRRKYYGIF